MLHLTDIKDWQDCINTVVCADCLSLMKLIPDGAIDLVLTDPPYGMNSHRQQGYKQYKELDKWNAPAWDTHKPDKKYFDELFRISQNQIVWGGNYFDLPPTPCFLIWDKVQRIDFADCEMAWTNFDTSARIYTFARSNLQGFRFPERKHPTQKPVELFKWCLKNYSKEDDLILDCFAGSFTTALAAEQLGRRWIACDISEKYCEIGEKRLDKERRQLKLFPCVAGGKDTAEK